jgi:hypothetical protein
MMPTAVASAIDSSTNWQGHTGSFAGNRSALPESDRPVPGEPFRQYALRRFAYSVVYENKPGALLIVAVVHQQRQFYWRHRRGL